jgi:hypothetical protein
MMPLPTPEEETFIHEWLKTVREGRPAPKITKGLRKTVLLYHLQGMLDSMIQHRGTFEIETRARWHGNDRPIGLKRD